MKNFLFLFFGLSVPFLIANASAETTLSEFVENHEVLLSESVSAESASKRTQVALESLGSALSGKQAFFSQVVCLKLQNLGVKAQCLDNLRSLLEKREIESRSILSPKLLVELTSNKEPGESAHRIRYSIDLFEYQRTEGSSNRFRAKSVSHREGILNLDEQKDIEDALSSQLQREIESLYRTMGKHRFPISSSNSKKSSTNKISYTMAWSDPDRRRGRLFFGVTAGTPAIVNLNIGYWGTRGLPLTVGISGMYFGPDNRGLSADLGWAFDNEGSVKQAASLVAVAFGETDKNVSEERDVFGRVIRTTTDTLNQLRPYIGPGYTARWNDIRFQGAVTLRADSAAQSSYRVHFQVGYTPSWGF